MDELKQTMIVMLALFGLVGTALITNEIIELRTGPDVEGRAANWGRPLGQAPVIGKSKPRPPRTTELDGHLYLKSLFGGYYHAESCPCKEKGTDIKKSDGEGDAQASEKHDGDDRR